MPNLTGVRGLKIYTGSYWAQEREQRAATKLWGSQVHAHHSRGGGMCVCVRVCACMYAWGKICVHVCVCTVCVRELLFVCVRMCVQFYAYLRMSPGKGERVEWECLVCVSVCLWHAPYVLACLARKQDLDSRCNSKWARNWSFNSYIATVLSMDNKLAHVAWSLKLVYRLRTFNY